MGPKAFLIWSFDQLYRADFNLWTFSMVCIFSFCSASCFARFWSSFFNSSSFCFISRICARCESPKSKSDAVRHFLFPVVFLAPAARFLTSDNNGFFSFCLPSESVVVKSVVVVVPEVEISSKSSSSSSDNSCPTYIGVLP